MASDATVTAAMILAAYAELERRGADELLLHLEATEPEIVNFVLERLSLLHGRLIRLGGPPKKTSAALRHARATVLVCVGAMRAAQYEQWRNSIAGTAVEGLDPSPEGEPAPDRKDSTPDNPVADQSREE